MSFETFFISTLAGGRPVVKIEHTSVRDGKWLVSGKVTFGLLRTGYGGAGPQLGQAVEPCLTLEFAFREAADEKDAVMQATKEMKAVLDGFLSVADFVLKQGEASAR